ncbi:Aspartyl/Asparaginyl beta-hydroxylase [Stanieria cyanosphaera PCC 7437]|uniref:Aspartyl/Asparaginyl beta-hydroxylase n=1 Tax=Stanieria cyanosphaera (strain ATCC 29371 / PCC 7437) TaxID=111780 RepID=K9XS54_STAC7|nr:Aspartyl/Asparaginyl beta-hydroxylase [Stanieria cyanosphaera PCC 7437]
MTQNINQIYFNWQNKYRQIILKQGEKLLRKLEQQIGKASLIGDRTFFESENFDWVAEVENSWLKIRQELDILLQNLEQLPNFQDISEDQYSITKDNLWKTYFLYAYGIKVEDNCIQCPETTKIIETIPGMKTAFFSILLPHKHIPEHCGPYKGVIRYHLALKVPEQKEKCGIRVGNDIRHWTEGKSLIFDDTFPHEAWNKTDEIRVVLFLDFVRPMRLPWSIINKSLIQLIAWSPLVQKGKKNLEKWNQLVK